MSTREAFEQVNFYVEFFEMMFERGGAGPEVQQTITDIRLEGQHIQAALTELKLTGEVLLDADMVNAGIMIAGTIGHMLKSPVGPLLEAVGLDPARADQTRETFRRMSYHLAVSTPEKAAHRA